MNTKGRQSENTKWRRLLSHLRDSQSFQRWQNSSVLFRPKHSRPIDNGAYMRNTQHPLRNIWQQSVAVTGSGTSKE